jgi:peptidoglycan/LPS O-acetylase OafA/YrhL
MHIVSEKSKSKSGRIRTLDSFRAIAIIAVILFHTFYYVNVSHGLLRIDVGNKLSSVFSYGYLGVEFFFIISGFVIFMTIRKSPSIIDFFFRRFARIYPAYIVSVVVIWTGVQLLGYEPYQTTLFDLFVSPIVWSPALRAAYVSNVYWSLVVELRFYVLIGLVYYTFGARWFGSAWLVLSLFATSSLWWSSFVATHVLSATLLPFFTMGILFNKVYSGEFDGAVDWLLVVVSLISFALTTKDIVVFSIIHVMLGVFLLFVHGKLEFLVVQPLQFLGRISYSLYLLHFELTLTIIGMLHVLGCSMFLAVNLAFLLLLIAASLLSYHIEEPARAALNRRYRIWRAGATTGRMPDREPGNFRSAVTQPEQDMRASRID